MFEPKRNAAAALLAAILSIGAMSASGADGSSYAAQYGAPADGRRVNREIAIDPRTRWVNVIEGEVVKFVARGASGEETSFTWNFDTFGGRSIDLGRIAPAGMLQRPVTVYIDYDPRYRGN